MVAIFVCDCSSKDTYYLIYTKTVSCIADTAAICKVWCSLRLAVLLGSFLKKETTQFLIAALCGWSHHNYCFPAAYGWASTLEVCLFKVVPTSVLWHLREYQNCFDFLKIKQPMPYWSGNQESHDMNMEAACHCVKVGFH